MKLRVYYAIRINVKQMYAYEYIVDILLQIS